MITRTYLRIALWASVIPAVAIAAFAAQQQQPDPLAEPFKGVTTDGTVVSGLFPIRATGVTTAPVREAAVKFIGALTAKEGLQLIERDGDVQIVIVDDKLYNVVEGGRRHLTRNGNGKEAPRSLQMSALFTSDCVSTTAS